MMISIHYKLALSCIRRLAASILILLLLISLTSCSLFTAGKINTEKLYMVEDMPGAVIKKPRRQTILLVTEPNAIPLYDTSQMVYSKRRYEVAFYAKNRWAETPSQMLTPLIAQTLQNTHHFRSVVQAPYVGRADYILNTQILKFQQNYIFCPATFDLTIKAQIIRTRTNTPVATKLIKIQEPINCEGPYFGVIAANKATAKALAILAYFVTTKI